MFHVELFSSSIATGANAFSQVTYFTPDNVLPKLVNGLQVSPMLPYLHFISGVGANLVHVRGQATSMLPFPYMSASPNNRGVAFESPPRFWDYTTAPVPLKPTEEFDIFASQNSGGAQTVYVLVGFSDGATKPLSQVINPPGMLTGSITPGRFFTVHSTTTTTVTAGQWSLVNPSFDQPLVAGYYCLIGARAYSATGLFFRMYPAMAPLWRPGGLCVQAYDQLDPDGQRYISPYNIPPTFWGQWLTFYQNVPPQIEYFCTGADTAQEAWFDLVYLGPQVISSAI